VSGQSTIKCTSGRELLNLYLLFLSFLLIAGLVVLRIIARRSYRASGRLSPLVSLIQALFFFVYGGFPALYLQEDWPAVHVNTWLHAVGLSFIIVGLGLLFYGMLHLGFDRSIGRGSQALERRGLYRYSRNPQALACGVYVAGFTFLWPSGYALGWALLYPVLIHSMVLTEEEHLLRLYGQDYADYCWHVPRYLYFRSKPTIKATG
jgi:protein-S-isoprenylcysteine O-methyltransferase Ste14